MEKLQQRLQQLELQRAQLSRSFDQISGGILEIQRQIKEELDAQAKAEVVEEDEVGVE